MAGTDFFGAMFEGIGKTFEAGANVNLGQIGERMQKRQLNYQQQQLQADTQAARLGYLFSFNQQQQKTLLIVVVAMIAFVGLLLLFRKR